MAGYYRRFIPNYADEVVPLTDLSKKGRPNHIPWEAPQQRAFERIKNLLCKAPVLQMPDIARSFIMQADASEVGIGVVLLQENEDGVFPVMYASKKLLPRERNYSAIECECLAIVFAVKFQNYIYGRELIIQTDHQPLSCIQKHKIDSVRIMRWALFLQN